MRDDEDRPRPKLKHELGQDLSQISVEELDERIALLREEIARLEADRARKTASKDAADQLFRL